MKFLAELLVWRVSPELRNEFEEGKGFRDEGGGQEPHLHVGGVPLAVPPGARDPGEGAVGVIKLVAIGVEEEGGKGLLHPKQKQTHFIINRCLLSPRDALPARFD